MAGRDARAANRQRGAEEAVLLHDDLAACNAYGDGSDTASSVRCATHLVVGTRDIMTPARGARSLAAILEQAGASVRTTEIDGSGHMLMSERPNEVLDALVSGLAAARAEVV